MRERRSRSRSRSRDGNRRRSRSRDRDDRRRRGDSGDRRRRSRSPSPPPIDPAKAVPLPGRRFFRAGPTLWDVAPSDEVVAAASLAAARASLPGTIVAGSTAPPQATRHARRLYVGGLEGWDEASIRTIFTQIARLCTLAPLPASVAPVLSVYMGKDARFAFVEFWSLELTTAMIGLNGMTVRGTGPVRVMRPSDYRPEAVLPDLRSRAEPVDFSRACEPLGIVLSSGGVTGPGSAKEKVGPIGRPSDKTSPWRIFIGNMPGELDEQKLLAIMQAFGAVKSLIIVRDKECVAEPQRAARPAADAQMRPPPHSPPPPPSLPSHQWCSQGLRLC